MNFKINIKINVFIWFLLCCLCLLTNVHAQDSAKEKRTRTKAALQVTDNNGKAVGGACITVGGIAYGLTDERGQITIETLPNQIVKVRKAGYVDFEVFAETLGAAYEIRLEKGNLYDDKESSVPLPFFEVKKRFSTATSSVVNGTDLEKYPSTDFRNSFTGLIPGLTVSENHGSPEVHSEESIGSFYSDKISVTSRGRRPIYIIDDVPTDVTEVQIEPHEIESATLVKDIAAKAMYGPQAANGIIFIKTRRGSIGEKQLKVNIESGYSFVDRFPRWTTAEDYCRLNNLAKANSGLQASYSDDDIREYRKNDPNNPYHPSVDFRKMTLKDWMNISRANVSYQGGKEEIQFFTSLGYSGSDDLFKIGPTANFKRLNARSNLDIKINEVLAVHMKIFGGLTFRKSPQYLSGTLSKFNILLNDINTTSPVAFPVYAKNEPENNLIWYGVDPIFTENPIGAVMDNGYYNEYGRSGTTNIALDYDMKSIVKGLKSKTFFSFDIFNLVRLGKVEQYAAYQVIPSKTAAGADTVLYVNVKDPVEQADMSNMHDYYYQRFGGYQNFTYNQDFGAGNSLQASLTYYLSTISRDTEVQPERQQNAVLATQGIYHDKYIFTGVLNFAGSSSLAPGKRYALFPSMGLGWIISEENFMSGIKSVNFLKLRGEAGILGYEPFDAPYYYKDQWTYNATGASFGAASTNVWFGSDSEAAPRSTPTRIGNRHLTWEKRKEFTIGLDAALFNSKLNVEVNYYNQVRDGVFTNLVNSTPYTTGIASMSSIVNYNRYRYYGLESSVFYSDRIRNFAFTIGGHATVQNSKVLKYDEPDYRFEYQSMIGQPLDRYVGLTYMGRFANDTEANETPQLFSEVLAAGDLKYKDLNRDGAVDDNDRSVIGHTSPRLLYALNLKMKYKNFDFTLVADGCAFVDLPLTNSYFRNGWGDTNYSEFVKDNIGGAYPRLTYYQVSNNFQASDFWLTNGGYFKIQHAELAYTLPHNVSNNLFLKKTRFFLRGANLLTITDVKYVDPEAPDAGVTVYPLFRTVTIGFNLIF